MPYVASPHQHYLDFVQKVDAFIGQTEKHLALCYSPKRTEFKFCALLAGWESTTCHDSEAAHWFDVWQEYCRKRHHGKLGRTLADPVNASPHSKRWPVPPEEETKAYSKVRDGMRRVWKVTLHHYYPGKYDDLSLTTGMDEAAILFRKIHASFRSGKAFASPEGLEVFLLTLIELFEQSLGTDEEKLISRKLWQSEIRRRRLGGSPETRTLADVAPAEVRLERQKAFPEKERTEILREMLLSMRRITKELRSYLEKQTP